MKSFLLFLALCCVCVPVFAGEEEESGYERVMRTGILQCGYFSWPPYMWKNPASGEFDGFFYEYTETVAARMGLKIDWVSEVVYGNIYQEIQSGKIDAFCSGIWPTAGLAKLLDFTIPITYNPVLAFVRAGDHRFDGDIIKLNDPAVKIASMEGAIAGVIAANRFQKAKLVETPQLSGPSSQILDLATGKVDVAFIDWGLVDQYLSTNPEIKVEPVAGVRPLNVWGSTIAFGKGNDALVNAVNTVTQEMIYSGEIDDLLDRYHLDSKGFFRPLRPYSASQK
jgi:polar amino acid transport system substrate-binding protein